MIRIARSSIWRWRRSTRPSLAITCWARSMLLWVKAVTASASCCSARPPISAIRCDSSFSSASYARTVWSLAIGLMKWPQNSGPASSVAAGDVILGLAIRRRREDRLGRAELDQLAQIHEGSEVGDARCLLHVVGHDHDRVIRLQLFVQLLYLGHRDRVERRR